MSEKVVKADVRRLQCLTMFFPEFDHSFHDVSGQLLGIDDIAIGTIDDCALHKDSSLRGRA